MRRRVALLGDDAEVARRVGRLRLLQDRLVLLAAVRQEAARSAAPLVAELGPDVGQVAADDVADRLRRLRLACAQRLDHPADVVRSDGGLRRPGRSRGTSRPPAARCGSAACPRRGIAGRPPPARSSAPAGGPSVRRRTGRRRSGRPGGRCILIGRRDAERRLEVLARQREAMARCSATVPMMTNSEASLRSKTSLKPQA